MAAGEMVAKPAACDGTNTWAMANPDREHVRPDPPEVGPGANQGQQAHGAARTTSPPTMIRRGPKAG